MSKQTARLETSDLILWLMTLTVLFFYPSAMDVFNFPKQWILICCTVGVLLHFLCSGKQRRHPLTRNTWFIGLLLSGTCCSMIASTVFSDTTWVRGIYGYPGRANGVLTFLCIFVVVWIGSNIVLPDDFQSKLRTRILIIYAIFSAYCVLQLLNLDPVPWNNPFNRIIGTLGNPNFSGAFLGVAAAVVLIGAYERGQEINRKYLLFSALLFGLSVSTQSIQAFGIFFVGVTVQILAFAFHHLNLRIFLAFLAFLSSLGILAIVSFLGIGPLGESLFQYTLRLRVEYWRVGLEIAQNFPLTGVGPDSYVEGFRLYRGQEFVGKYSQAVIADSAHNVPINFMANYGIPAFLFFMALIIVISINSIRIIFSDKVAETGTKMLAMAWILLLVQSLFSLEQIGLNVFQWCCGAFLLNRQLVSTIPEVMENRVRKIVSKVGAIENLRTEITALSVTFLMLLSWSLMKQEIAIQRLVTTPEGAKLTELELETRLSDLNSFTRIEVRRAIYLSDYLIKIQKYDEAQLLLEDLVKIDPDAYEALEQLARLARFNANLELEIDYRKRIEIIDPFNYENRLSIARSLKETGKLFEAKRYAEKVLAISRDARVNESATAILDSK